MTKPHIAIVIASTRTHRFADKPAQWLLAEAGKRTDMSFEIVDLRDFDLPLFDEAGPIAFAPTTNPGALAWQRKIAGFDGYVFVTPEYNYSIPGALKNALDLAYKEWNRKPAAAFGYGGVGAARAIEALRTIMVALQMAPIGKAVHLAGGEFFKVSPLGADGSMDEVAEVLRPSVKAMLDDLAWWAHATRAARQADLAEAA